MAIIPDPESPKKSYNVSLKFSENERNQIRQEAKKQRISISKLIKNFIFNAESKKK